MNMGTDEVLVLELPSSPWYTFPDGSVVKNPPANTGDTRESRSTPGLGRSLKEEMATRSCILAWKIPWTEEPGELESVGFAESDTTEYTSHLLMVGGRRG